MKRKTTLCSFDNVGFLEGVIGELEETVTAQATAIEDLEKVIDQLRAEVEMWRNPLQDIITLLLTMELPEGYKGISKEESL